MAARGGSGRDVSEAGRGADMRRVRALWMRLLGSLGFGLRSEAVDADVRAELESHVQLQAAEYERRGLSPAQARRRALLESGGITRAAESVRMEYGLPWLENFLADVRYAVRGLVAR